MAKVPRAHPRATGRSPAYHQREYLADRKLAPRLHAGLPGGLRGRLGNGPGRAHRSCTAGKCLAEAEEVALKENIADQKCSVGQPKRNPPPRAKNADQ